MANGKQSNISPLNEDFEDFFEKTRTGYLITDSNGQIIRGNSCVTGWLGVPGDNIIGKRFSDLLSIGGKIYYETHLWPMLRIQGFFDEVSLELVCSDGNKLKVTVNGYERRNEKNEPLYIRLTILKATDRYTYEQNLRNEKALAENMLSNEKAMALLREQFIAVLGHDLRNPLSSVLMGAENLNSILKNEDEIQIAVTIKRSAARMSELITNVMDFARTRMGDGIGLRLQRIDLVPVLKHVVDELQTVHPKRIINTSFNITENVFCDAARLSQLLSNLLGNALTHGAENKPVFVSACIFNNNFELSVSNSGAPIPPDALDRLFQPFTREDIRPSLQGLGLGLYIASEIARAHNGDLSVISNAEQTKFTFKMNITY